MILFKGINYENTNTAQEYDSLGFLRWFHVSALVFSNLHHFVLFL